MNFFSFSDYTINLNQVADIDREDPDSWEVYMSSGHSYTLEDDDLESFKKATGL